MKINEATKLVQDIKKLTDSWDERSQFKLAWEKNLSMADLDVLLMYCQRIFNTWSIYGLVEPMWSIARILKVYWIITD